MDADYINFLEGEIKYYLKWRDYSCSEVCWLIDHWLIGTLVGKLKRVERVEKCAIKIYISAVLVATRQNLS